MITTIKGMMHKIKNQFDLRDLKGDSLEDLAKFFLFVGVIAGLGILTLIIEIVVWIFNHI